MRTAKTKVKKSRKKLKAEAGSGTCAPSDCPKPAGMRLVEKTAREVLDLAEDREKFSALFSEPNPVSSAIIWRDERRQDVSFKTQPPVSFQPAFVDRIDAAERPGGHPAHAQGAYYCLDMSSVFMAAPLLEISTLGTAEAKPKILDMCASPGGKSIFAWRALAPELLISNEVIGKRLGALISNLERCRISPAAVHRETAHIETLL